MKDAGYIYSLELEESTMNLPMQSVVDRLSAIVDKASKKVFQSVDFGLYIPGDTPPTWDSPFARVWVLQESWNIEASQFVARDVDFVLQIYSYLNIPPTNAAGEYVRIQKIRQNITQAIRKGLEPQTRSNPHGMTPDRWWKVPAGVKVNVDYATPFRYYGQILPQQPPLYVTRIDIPINVAARIPEGALL